MSNRRLKNTDLKDALASAEEELDFVLKRADQLREWIAVTKKLCAKNTKASEHEGSPVTRFRRTRATSTLEHVLEVLAKAGKPLHVDDIVSRLAANNHASTAKNPKATIAVALSRRPDQFRKTGPNTFGIASSVSTTEEVVTLVS